MQVVTTRHLSIPLELDIYLESAKGINEMLAKDVSINNYSFFTELAKEDATLTIRLRLKRDEPSKDTSIIS
jgi:hypothetical protein